MDMAKAIGDRVEGIIPVISDLYIIQRRPLPKGAGIQGGFLGTTVGENAKKDQRGQQILHIPKLFDVTSGGLADYIYTIQKGKITICLIESRSGAGRERALANQPLFPVLAGGLTDER